MDYIVNLVTEINNFSDEELVNNFKKLDAPFGRMNYYAVFAKRIIKYKNIIFDELITEKNVKIEFRTFKPSWYIAISILDYCEDENIIKEMITHIKSHWGKDDFDDFKHYVSKEDRFKKYF